MTHQDQSATPNNPRVLALCGGIGGAKLALGLYRMLEPGALAVAVNTGDDFTHLGFHISPDIDTVLYTLGGLNDTERGWGRADETWNFMAALTQLGGDDWFALGDKDLATHVERSLRLAEGETLTAITERLAMQWGIHATILPMSDDPVRTIVETEQGVLSFQDYFVRQRCEPEIKAIHYEGADQAKFNPRLRALLNQPDLEAVVICPSNPYLSVAPILAIPGVKQALAECAAPVIAISPIIQGAAVKGPTAKIMSELGLEPDAPAIAEYYQGLLNGFVLDKADEVLADKIDLATLVVPTLMQSLEDRDRLAKNVLDFAHTLSADNTRSVSDATEMRYGG